MRIAKLHAFAVLLLLAVVPAATAGPAKLEPNEMAYLPDDEARAAAQAFADAVEKEDAAALKALVPEKGMVVLKKKKSLKQVAAILDKKGVAGLVGRLPKGMVPTAEDKKAGLNQGWHVAFEQKWRHGVLYRVEFGVIREAVIAEVGKEWKLVELRNADHGEP